LFATDRSDFTDILLVGSPNLRPLRVIPIRVIVIGPDEISGEAAVMGTYVGGYLLKHGLTF
jgi:hypothetical protein